MTEGPVHTHGESRDAAPRLAPARPAATPHRNNLERLRDVLVDRLDAIGALAGELADQLDLDSSDRERALRDRVAVLEAAHARTLAEQRRREEEWQETMNRLEADRHLLAAAWERLERLQIQFEPRADPRSPPADAPAPTAVRSTAADSDDPVTRAILRQFQTLAGDVRRNARGKGPQ